MPEKTSRRLVPFFSPLTLAACVAWVAVWMSLDFVMARDAGQGWLARGFALAFLAGFLAEDFLSDRLGRHAFPVLAVALALCAYVPIALAPNTAAPILLILLAAMLGARYKDRALWLWLLGVNIGLAVAIWRFWPDSGYKWISAFGYASFQVFAALVMRYAVQAEEMSEALRAANADLVATRSLLAEGARDQERLRLARELHDVAGHKLTALKLNLSAMARETSVATDPRTALCAQLADELMADIRGVVQAMRQDDGIPLAATIRAMATALPRPNLELEVDEDARPATLAQAEAILRTVQEALTNAARHSEARTLWAVLTRDRDRLRLDLRDDGRGRGELKAGNGLRGMRERLQSLGGDLAVDRTDTGGVHLRAWLPLEAP